MTVRTNLHGVTVKVGEDACGCGHRRLCVRTQLEEFFSANRYFYFSATWILDCHLDRLLWISFLVYDIKRLTIPDTQSCVIWKRSGYFWSQSEQIWTFLRPDRSVRTKLGFFEAWWASPNKIGAFWGLMSNPNKNWHFGPMPAVVRTFWAKILKFCPYI